MHLHFINSKEQNTINFDH